MPTILIVTRLITILSMHFLQLIYFYFTITLAATLELDDGRSYVGLTAATGDEYWQAHDILRYITKNTCSTVGKLSSVYMLLIGSSLNR